MKVRWISAVLLLACNAGWADHQEELRFASKLGARGLTEMALKILDDLEGSRDPAAARAGRYGKALLDKQQASIARLRFMRALDDGEQPPVTRERVLEIYAGAKPKIEDYVTNRGADLDARFLLGELLQEYAEFLVGADYPDDMKEQRAKLVADHGGDAEKLFEAAVGHYAEVAKQMGAALEKEKEVLDNDPRFIRLSNAQYNKAHARLRWALLYPKGPKFNYRSEEAIEELDEFLAAHFEDIFGAYAMLDLGICYLERGLRQGSQDDAETAVNYFNTLYTTVPEDPTVPETMEVISKAFYWYASACNSMARGDEALKPQPVYYTNTIRSGTELRERLKHGNKRPFALKSLLFVAEAFAAQNRFNDAVILAGDTLGTARVEGQRQIANQATALLTNWVARVTGVGALDPALLFQIGESLTTQGRTGAAITFFEKAMASATTDEDKEKWAYPARVRIAKAYRRDKRLFAGGMIAWEVVKEYVASGEEEDSAFGQVASEACNDARLAFKQISEATNRGKDRDQYQKVLGVFRDKFPGHPENSDAAFTTAREFYTKGQFREAASALADISPSSRNYWLAQRMVPSSYRNLAAEEKEDAERKGWHEKTLASAQNLVKLAEAQASDPKAQTARQTGHLFVAMAYASLKRWPEALKSIDDYLRRYPDRMLKKGLEYMIKIDAHIAQNQLDEAEAALAALAKKVQPKSSILRRSNYTVFEALRKEYLAASDKKERVAIATRAAALLEAWLESQKEKSYKLHFFYGEVLADAERYSDAKDAYELAAQSAPDESTRQGLTQRAAETAYMAAINAKDLSRKDKIQTLEATRDLFTDVLIRKEDQAKVLKALGSSTGWPSNADFGKIKRNARALSIAAKIYKDNAPAGLDGRYVALRLIHHQHSFTQPVEDPSKPQLTEFIPLWWESAELKLQVYLAIAQSGAGAAEKDAAKDGLGFAKKLLFQYRSMDGPARVNAVKALEAQLKLLAR